MKVDFGLGNICAPKHFQQLSVQLSNQTGSTIVKNVRVYSPNDPLAPFDISNATLVGTYTSGNNFNLPHTAVINIPPNHQAISDPNNIYYVIAEIDQGTSCDAIFNADFNGTTISGAA